MRRYPDVLGEYDTLAAVVEGASLARYGDGELKMCEGSSLKSQTHVKGLQERLREILMSSGQCLVGLPNLHCDTPKIAHWRKYHRYSRLLPNGRTYVSAFVTRPDSAPWIDTPEYWASVESLWRGQSVTLVRGSTKSLVAADLEGAALVREIVAPRQHAWGAYADLLAEIGTPDRALLCLGPTATVLAVDLAARGVHAIDLGHLGMFLRKHRRGDPMWVTDADKAAAN